MSKRGKPGELALACGIGLLFVGPVVLGILSQEDGELATLQSVGVVAHGTVTGHTDQVENYTQRGKPRTRINHYIDLSYDLNAATPYGEWLASGVIAPSAYPATVTGRLDVGERGQMDHPVATNVAVVFVSGQSDSLMLVEELQHRTSWSYHVWQYLAVGATMILGVFLTVTGWRKWRTSG